MTTIDTPMLRKAQTEELTSSEIEDALRELHALDPNGGHPIAVIGHRRWTGSYCTVEYPGERFGKYEGRAIEDALLAAEAAIRKADVDEQRSA